MVKRGLFGPAVCWLSKQAIGRYLASGLRIKVEGMEHVPKRGAAILVANHVCALDGWLLLCAIRRKLYFFTRAEHFANPIAAWYGRAMGALPAYSGVDSGASLAAAEAVLRADQLFASFPEGNVNPEPSIPRPFKSGFLLLAQKLGVPVVPVAIIGSQRALRDPVRPRGRRAFRLQSADVQLIAMEPIVFYNPTGDRELFEWQREQVRQVIADKIGERTASKFSY
jgi:1-acyl-sn-glycerol-3-phosphate acyltransferase